MGGRGAESKQAAGQRMVEARSEEAAQRRRDRQARQMSAELLQRRKTIDDEEAELVYTTKRFRSTAGERQREADRAERIMREERLGFTYPRDLALFAANRMGLDTSDIRIVDHNPRRVTLMRYRDEYPVPDWSVNVRRDGFGNWGIETEVY